MPAPPIPPSLEELGERKFSFYPPIIGVEHNEFQFQRATWSEMLVCNTRTDEEIWIPRRYVGEVSRIDEPVMIVGLVKELEFKSGQVFPHERRVIELPRAVNDTSRHAPSTMDQPLSEARPELVHAAEKAKSSENRIGKMIVGALVLGILVTVLVINYFGRSKIEYAAVMQSDLEFTPQDDYYAVVRKLGQPASDHYKSDKGEQQYRALGYPQQGYTIILMGIERGKENYIGAMNKDWRPVHSVKLSNRSDTRSLLTSLPRF